MTGGARRDNGLRATSYIRLDDVATHLVDELLDRLRAAGVAAYSAPTGGRQGPYGDTVPPSTPSDAVYVDAAHEGRARTITDGYLREIRDDLAFSDIVAGYDLDSGPEGGVARWPASEDVTDQPDARSSGGGPTIGFEILREGTPTSPVVRRDDDGGHYEPPPPPPLPAMDRITRLAWTGALGGPLLLLLAALVGLELAGWVGLLAIGAFVAGFVTLVARMQDRPPTDTGPDDGAVV